MGKRGRPTLLNKQLKEICVRLARKKGMTLAKMAEILGVSENTLRLSIQEDADLLRHVKNAQDLADEMIESALWQRAVGYQHDEEKVFCHTETGAVTRVKVTKQYPPSEKAAEFWLTNRRRSRWRREGAEDETSTDIPIQIAGDESDL